MDRKYTVSQYNGRWYAHRTGFPNVPVLDSFSETKRDAQKHAAACMALTLVEYLKYTKERK